MAHDRIAFHDEIAFEDIYAAATCPRYYGKRYLIADSEQKLIFVLSEACCISAFSLVQILQLPRRGRLVLAMFKTLFPKKYESYQFLYNFSFSHCLIYISRKLKTIFNRNLTEIDAEAISENAYAYGGSYFGFIN